MNRRSLAAAGLVSVLLHGGAVWLLLPHGGGRVGMDEPPAIEIELVDQAFQVQGAAAATPGQPPPEPEPTPPLPQAARGDVATPPPPARPSPPGRPAQPAVNLAGAEQDQEALSVIGRDVVPPRPDGSVRNKPPAYPVEAARRRAEGVVGLRIHVTEAGTPAWVDVVESSGEASLDRAAREAVALWRFQPARNNGAAVPYDFLYRIKFSLGALQ